MLLWWQGQALWVLSATAMLLQGEEGETAARVRAPAWYRLQQDLWREDFKRAASTPPLVDCMFFCTSQGCLSQACGMHHCTERYVRMCMDVRWRCRLGLAGYV